MKTALATTSLVLALASSASAGGFVGLGVGTGSQLDDGKTKFAENGRSDRLTVGYDLPLGFGRIGVEGAYTGYGLTKPGHTMDGTSIWLAGRFDLTLSDGFAVFGRLGVQTTNVTDASDSYDGKGPVLGVGAAFRPGFKVLDLSVWVDLTYLRSSLDHAGVVVPASDHFATAGISLGF